MTQPKHTLSFAYERLGDENVVAVRCTQHPDFVESVYTWPSNEQLRIIGTAHDPDYDWHQEYP